MDIRVLLPDGTLIRERKKAPASSKSAAQRWAEARERVLLVHGKPKPVKKEEVQQKPTLEEFAPRFLDGYAKANRLKPSGIASKKSVLSVHLIPLLGDKRLDEITTEDVQRLKAALGHRSAKTANNVLTVLSVMLRTAVEWDVIARVPCAIKLLKTTKSDASFYDFEQYERLVEAARSDPQAFLVALLVSEAGLRCGEMMALDTTQRYLHLGPAALDAAIRLLDETSGPETTAFTRVVEKSWRRREIEVKEVRESERLACQPKLVTD